MHSLSVFGTLLLALSSIVSAAPTRVEDVKRACTTILPSLRVPVDATAPDRVYGNSQEVTIWKNPTSPSTFAVRNTLLKFDVPAGVPGPCTLKFIAAANPPIAVTNGPVTINTFSLVKDVLSNNSWNTKPGRQSLFGTTRLDISKTNPTSFYINSAACAPTLNYELEMVTNGGSIGFTSQPGTGFILTYGC